MSILIRGMKMPKNCWECPMVSGYEISDDVKALCSTVRCRLTNTKRPAGEAIAPNCPLVHIPPHGRLIDADALFDFILNIYKTAQGDARKAYRDVLDTIIAAGDVIPAEEGE